ncbi:DUF1857-domain-containing protein [Hypoxylon sp. FL1284]|nr:DUF1857-domain-containing protein [Hypoxylon sp. FL1284]
MVTFNLAYTAPINPAGATPALDVPQVWAGLERKTRRPQDFVPAIEGCRILSETAADANDDGHPHVVREVRFRAGQFAPGAGAVVRETCVHMASRRADFFQPDGSSVANVVSDGPAGELLLTFAFEWRYPDAEAGGDEAVALEEKCWKTAKTAVHGTIDTIRRLVKEGEIQ